MIAPLVHLACIISHDLAIDVVLLCPACAIGAVLLCSCLHVIDIWSSAEVSLFLFPSTNWFRRFLLSVVESSIFETIVTITILLNCVALALVDPTEKHQDRNNILVRDSSIWDMLWHAMTCSDSFFSWSSESVCYLFVVWASSLSFMSSPQTYWLALMQTNSLHSSPSPLNVEMISHVSVCVCVCDVLAFGLVGKNRVCISGDIHAWDADEDRELRICAQQRHVSEEFVEYPRWCHCCGRVDRCDSWARAFWWGHRSEGIEVKILSDWHCLVVKWYDFVFTFYCWSFVEWCVCMCLPCAWISFHPLHWFEHLFCFIWFVFGLYTYLFRWMKWLLIGLSALFEFSSSSRRFPPFRLTNHNHHNALCFTF